MTESSKQKLIDAATSRLRLCEQIYNYFCGLKKINTGITRTMYAAYKEEMAAIINEKTAALQDLQNHVFSEPQPNPLEKFVDAQEKEINDLKAENKKLVERFIVMEKLAKLADENK